MVNGLYAWMALTGLDTSRWHGSVLGTECTFHQIAPYIGKMKSSMAKEIIQTYSCTGDLIFDPFAGSGAIALESLMARRAVVCTDINPYAVTLTEAKLTAPRSAEEALKKADEFLDRAMPEKLCLYCTNSAIPCRFSERCDETKKEVQKMHCN